METKKLFIFGAVLAAATSAMADLRSDTQMRFDRYAAAVKHKDAKNIEKVLRETFAPDFKFVMKSGKTMGLSQWIADEKMMIGMTRTVTSVTLHIDSVKMRKGAADMQVTLNYVGIASINPKHKPGLLKYTATSDQTMVEKNGKWWVAVMKEGTSKTLFNGKPLGM